MFTLSQPLRPPSPPLVTLTISDYIWKGGGVRGGGYERGGLEFFGQEKGGGVKKMSRGGVKRGSKKAIA